MLDHVTELLASLPEGEDENQEEENGDLEEEELDSTSSGDEEMDTQWQWIHERPLQELREVRWLVYIFTKKAILSGFAAGRIQRLSPTIISHLLQVGDLISCCLLHWSGVSLLKGPRTACGVFPPFYCILHCSRVCLGIIGIVERHRKNSVFPPKFAIVTLCPELVHSIF